MTIADGALLLVVALGAGADLATGKIPNALTYPSCVFALVLAGAVGGWGGLGAAFAGLAVGFTPFFVLYLLGGLGGGDVKLMAVVGAFTGAGFATDALLASVLAGAVVAALIVIWEGQGGALVRFLGATVGRLFLPGRPRPELAARRSVPFGVAICFGTVVTLLVRWRGLGSPIELIPGM